MGMLPVRKYVEDEGGPGEPFTFSNVPPKDIKLVFECEDCGKKQTDDVSNVTYNGAPMCCNDEMLLSHAEVTV